MCAIDPRDGTKIFSLTELSGSCGRPSSPRRRAQARAGAGGGAAATEVATATATATATAAATATATATAGAATATTAATEKEEEDPCPICKEELAEEPVYTLDCKGKHKFHCKCIYKWSSLPRRRALPVLLDGIQRD